MKKATTAKDTFLGLRVDADLAERLRVRAAADERSVSSFVRRLIAAAVR